MELKKKWLHGNISVHFPRKLMSIGSTVEFGSAEVPASVMKDFIDYKFSGCICIVPCCMPGSLALSRAMRLWRLALVPADGRVLRVSCCESRSAKARSYRSGQIKNEEQRKAISPH